MMLKLTGRCGTLLVDTTSVAITLGGNDLEFPTRVFQQCASDTDFFSVKETIEEITQQIKEGGIYGTN